MVTKYVNQPLGMGNCFSSCGSPRPKQWIQAVLAAASLASSLYGGYKASQATKEAEKRQREKEASDRAWYNRRYNENYIDTAAGQNLVRRAKDYANEQWRKAAGAQAVAGGTDAATQMAKDAGNRMVGDTIANIAAQDVARKDRADAIQRQNEAQYAQMDMARANTKAANITQAAQGASNAMAGMAGALGGGVNLKGGSNASTVANTPTTKQGGHLPDSGTVNLHSDVEGIHGQTDLDWLRGQMGVPY